MKLLNQSFKYLSVSILAIVSVWAIIFYYVMLGEIKSSTDEGLENTKRWILEKAEREPQILNVKNFDISNFTCTEIPQTAAMTIRTSYRDTVFFMQDKDDPAPEPEPVRIMTTAFENNGKYYKLNIINSLVEESDMIKDLFWLVLGLYVLLVGSIVVVNNWVLQKLWHPFYYLLEQLKNFKLAKSQPLPGISTRTKEFNDLQTATNTLIQHSIETYEQQKQFIGNASHELQTPLAVAINHLELTLEKGKLEAATAETIAQVLQTLERLTRLNKSLLLLTKIENKQFFDNQEISITTITQQCLAELEELADYKSIKIVQKENAPLIVKMDNSLAQIVITNLVKNALFYSAPNSEIGIEITNRFFKISNAGTQSLDKGKIFSRFYKSPESASGTGLGLAIVKTICQLYGFTIAYQFSNQQHCFTVSFS